MPVVIRPPIPGHPFHPKRGYPDLYFLDYDAHVGDPISKEADFNDKLLVNLGEGKRGQIYLAGQVGQIERSPSHLTTHLPSSRITERVQPLNVPFSVW